ncbi:MAG: hypothetical protein LUF89_03435 [Ruminococcus sp.]|nr:hypothetical protein [Ruminococcus sp.]
MWYNANNHEVDYVYDDTQANSPELALWGVLFLGLCRYLLSVKLLANLITNQTSYNRNYEVDYVIHDFHLLPAEETDIGIVTYFRGCCQILMRRDMGNFFQKRLDSAFQTWYNENNKSKM